MLLDFRAIKARVTMEDVLTLIGWKPLKKTRDQWRGPCPFCSDKPRSDVFSVNLVKKCFQCFRCRRAGNHIELFRDVEREDSIYTAARMLAEVLMIDPIYLEG